MRDATIFGITMIVGGALLSFLNPYFLSLIDLTRQIIHCVTISYLARFQQGFIGY